MQTNDEVIEHLSGVVADLKLKYTQAAKHLAEHRKQTRYWKNICEDLDYKIERLNGALDELQ